MRERYGGGEPNGFGPPLAAEHGLEVDHETLRRWMQAAQVQRRRKRRPPRERFGELLQLDGSHHRWLEERGEKACLLNLVDDATARGLFWFAGEETTGAGGSAGALGAAIWRTAGAVLRQEERLSAAGDQPRDDRGDRAADAVWADVREARHPRDRPVVARSEGRRGTASRDAPGPAGEKMRLAGIADYEAANRFLEGYEQEHDERFARRPAAAADFHLKLPRRLDPRRVFCLEQERVVSRDFVVASEGAAQPAGLGGDASAGGAVARRQLACGAQRPPDRP